MRVKRIVTAATAVLLFATPSLAQNAGNPAILQQVQQARQDINALRALIEKLITQGGQPGADARKLYYLTTTQASPLSAPTACSAGFHFASLWEIFDTSNLRYDTSVGTTSADSGEGPPTLGAGPQAIGWIRTGNLASGTPIAGRGNCQAWTSDGPGDDGTVLGLPDSWSSSSGRIEPWVTTTSSCNFPHSVWCIQD